MSWFFPSRHAVGICIARRHVAVAHLRRGRSGWEVQELTAQALSTPLFEASPGEEIVDELAQVLARIAGPASRGYVPVQVALPDAAVRGAVFELAEMPKSASSLAGLIEFRFKREATRSVALACVGQSLGRDSGKSLVFGMAMETPWRDALRRALHRVGAVAWRMGPSVLQYFDLLHERLVAQSGALVAVSVDCWALLLWDSQGRLRYCVAHWRDASAADGEHEWIASEVARSIVAYVDEDASRTVEQIFLVGSGEIDSLATVLDRRATRACNKLSVVPLLCGTGRRPETAPEQAALAAAMSL